MTFAQTRDDVNANFQRGGSLYRPGERGWVKIKNRNYWRYEMERESVLKRPRSKQFV